VVGLAEVDQLQVQPPVGHDVARLQVQVRDPVLLQVAQRLRDHQHEVDLGVERQRQPAALDVLAQVGRTDVVDEQVVLVGVVLLGQQVVLGQEHGEAELDLGEDEAFVGDATLAAQLRHAFVLALDDDVLLERRRALEAVLRDAHAVGPHVPVLDLGEVDGGEAAHFDLLQHRLRQLLVHLDVVQHEEVLVRDAAFLVQGQLQALADVGTLEKA
jgi:hypothetical protein